MEDRVSLYPGRVTLTPVEGQPNTYDMVRADQPTQQGTALSKANLLKDTTAAQFGLGSEAVPDDVLGWIGKYNEYWWRLLHGETYSYYKEEQELNTEAFSIGGTSYYSKSITVDAETGDISLVEPTKYLYTASNYSTYMQTLCSLAPIYFQTVDSSDNTKIFFIPAGATYYDESWSTTVNYTFSGWRNSSTGVTYIRILAPSDSSICARVVSSELVTVPAGETTYEHSTDRNAYPDSGTVDGIKYTYLGVPFEKLPGAVQIETGSYTGAGVYGSNNYNRLDFDFAPKLLMIRTANGMKTGPYGAILSTNNWLSGNYTTAQSDYYFRSIITDTATFQVTDDFGSSTAYTNYVNHNGQAYNNTPMVYFKKSTDGKTIVWKADNVDKQLNLSCYTYYYVAIG